MAFSGALLWWCGLRGWYPHDEGLLGQSAQRLLRGEIPHRDFGDPYTGGLSLWHAGVFYLFGERLSALRRVFDLVAWGWSALFFTLARRWLSGWGAALATILALVWSVPIYPAAMPSWYLLFLVTAALAILVRGEGEWHTRSLLAAGACLGLAVLMKVTALFAVAGIFIALGRIRQLADRNRAASPELLLGAGLFIAATALLTLPTGSTGVVTHIFLPTIALAVAVFVVEVRTARTTGLRGDAQFRRQVLTLTAGAAIPLLPFVSWLALEGGLTPFLHSLSGVAQQRATFAGTAPPLAMSAFLAVPLLLVILGIAARAVRAELVAVVFVLLWIAAWLRGDAHRAVWHSVRGLVPVGATLLAVSWLQRDTPRNLRRADHVLVALTCASLALGQFPFASAIYFVYLAPLVVLSIVSIVPDEIRYRKQTLLAAAFLVAFSVAQVLPGTPRNRGFLRRPPPVLGLLPGLRGGLKVPEDQASVYRQLLAVMDSVGDTLPIWAGPDAPEVAFLAGRRDRNGAFFGFLDQSGAGGVPSGQALYAQGVRTVVVQRRPQFTPRPEASELAALAEWYPEFRRVGDFEVRWRARAP